MNDLALQPVTPLARVTANDALLKAIGPHVERHHVANIQGRKYVMVAGAQAIATGLGYTTSISCVRYVPTSETMAGYWEATATVLNERGLEVGRGIGCVFDDERPWNTRPQFARQMMAQTRATGRALKGVVGWAFAMLGAESSLAEEMPAEAAGMPQAASAAPRRLPAPSSTEKALGGKAAPAKPKQTIVAIVQQVDAKTSKAGKPYWRLAVEAGEGTEWFTSFKAVDEAVIGKRMTLVLGTTAKGDTVIDDVYEAVEAEEVPF